MFDAMLTRVPLSPVTRLHVGATALFAFVATVICAPVLPDPLHTALGHPGNDIWNHVWGYWWVEWSLAQGKLPLHTTELGWPNGGSLWFIDIFNAVMTLPIQWVAGPVAAYNGGIWLNLVLCGFGTYVLARAVTQSDEGAILAGVAFMTAPHLLAQIYNGISETIGAGWLPLAILALRNAARDPTPRNGAIAGVAVAVTAVSNWYYGLFSAIILAGLLVRAALRESRRRFKSRRLKDPMIALAAGGLTLGAVAAIPFGLFAQSMSAPDALVTRDPGFVWMTLVMHNMTDVLALFHPGKFYSPDLHATFSEDLIVVVYMGAALLIPSAVVFGRLLQEETKPWVLLLGVFTLLSLGPFLFVDGSYVVVAGGWIPLPFLALFQWFPMFSRISHAYRFAVGSALVLAILVAFVVRVAPKFGVSARTAAITIGLARLLEAFVFSPAVFPLPTSVVSVPEAYTRIAGGAVIDLPITMPVLARSKLLINQIIHKQPVPFGLNDPVPRYLHVNHYTHYIVGLERRTTSFLPPEIPFIDLVAGQADLRARGARWIVVHRDGYTADQYLRVAHFLDLTAQAVIDDGVLRVYDLAFPLAEGPEGASPGAGQTTPP